MLRPASFLALLALAAASPALTVSFAPNLSIVRPEIGTSFLTVTGTMLYGGVPPHPVSTETLLSLSATGPGRAFETADGVATGSILGHFATGVFTGDLFTIAISSTTVPGVYSGPASIRLKYSNVTATQTAAATVTFTVLAPPPPPVPEPSALATVGIGVLALVRRRRRS